MTMSNTTNNSCEQNQIAAARHICEEASKVLSTLRRGPPLISHGSLVHNLRELRRQVKVHYLDPQPQIVEVVEYLNSSNENEEDGIDDDATMNTNITSNNDAVNLDAFRSNGERQADEKNDHDNEPAMEDTNTTTETMSTTTSVAGSEPVLVDKEHADGETATEEEAAASLEAAQQSYRQQLIHKHLQLVQVGKYAQPFLDIILDPRAAGPHTLIALRSLHRLVSRKSLTLFSSTMLHDEQHQQQQQYDHDHNNSTLLFVAEMEPLMRGILECRFEQTDVGADEAVEMAIADFLSLIVSLDTNRHMNAEVIMEAFNTVFVTRNTFVHSPALCYHFEQVLDGMICDLFSNLSQEINETSSNSISPEEKIDEKDLGENHGHCSAAAATLIIDFLVSQLLHTPMTLDDGGNNIVNSGSIEAFTMHNDTRILCLRLIQTCLKIGWGSRNNEKIVRSSMMNGILKIIQDDLCLALLLIGQGIWAYQDPSSGALPGMISMNVLSEICSTLTTMWSISPLRNILTTQFETIFTGFYQRALSLLRRLPVPHDSASFHVNQIFDAEAEIILESLVDILSLHYADNGCATFESLFITYDCNTTRPDVAAGLVDELSRCCTYSVEENMDVEDDAGRMPTSAAASGSNASSRHSSTNNLEQEFVPQIRDVPAHLKELCEEALTGVMKTLFCGRNKNQQVLEPLTSEIRSNPLRRIKEKKVLMRKAVQLFNKKSSTGFDFLLKNGLIADPVTPEAIASFLRNGIVLGMDKPAAGEYLGSKGKSPVAGKSPPDWERDWFHKEALSAYCSSFHFNNQSLLDGLRMFLAAFRLPGEAQQIDRILQAFAESCGLQCEESKNGGLFSNDPKKASDAAYLLSFSIIMLNTDLHNDNIRPDRKMKMEDFVKNNADYGRDITDPDKKLPPEYLEGIYVRIRDEHIRTEGEGADGIMTFERWKDVMRSSVGECVNDHQTLEASPVLDLVLEALQHPIFTAVCGFWAVSTSGDSLSTNRSQSGMLGVQGARVGMDLAFEMIQGLKNLGQSALFQDFFVSICHVTGLLGNYKDNAVQRTSSFVESIERQSAVVVVMKAASNLGDYIGTRGWICVLGILFELRDLKLLGGGTSIKHRSLIIESDPDFLRIDARRDWEMRLVKQCYEATGGDIEMNGIRNQKSGLLGAVGRAFFGSAGDIKNNKVDDEKRAKRDTASKEKRLSSSHGKEELVLWDDLALSDDEDELDATEENDDFSEMNNCSLGNEFEIRLISEEKITSQPGPITGLETYEDTRILHRSPRAKVRKRLSKLCDFSMIVSETRFLDLEGVNALLAALMEIVASKDSTCDEVPMTISPGSEALAEVMITEIALKNRDRISSLWSSNLKSHYQYRLSKIEKDQSSLLPMSVTVIPGVEKCLTGILRICCHTVHREGINDDVLNTLKLVSSYCDVVAIPESALTFNKHIAEGLWRICRDVDGLVLVGDDGWNGILDLMKYCAKGGETLLHQEGAKFNNLSDDDPALQAFRCMHLILHSLELRENVPFEILFSVRSLINGGESQNCPKLSLAGLDLLLVLLTKLQMNTEDKKSVDNDSRSYWLSLIEGLAEASDSKFPSTRQHSMAMLRDALIGKYIDQVSTKEISHVLNGICMPTSSQRMSELVQHQGELQFDPEEIMIELELCISSIFKPFLHHLDKLMEDPEELIAVWMSLLSVLSQLLGKENSNANELKILDGRMLAATKDLATEHLRNSVMILISKGILECDDDDDAEHVSPDGKDISSVTWNALSNIKHCKHYVPEWRKSGNLQKS